MKKYLVLTLLALLLLSGCTPKERPVENNADPLVIGVFEPLSGLYGETGKETMRGISLAHTMRSRAIGKPVELAVYNTKSQSFESANAVSTLTDRGAIGLIGTFGSDSMRLAKPVIRAARVPTVTGSTSPDLKDAYWITQISISDDEQAKAMASFADKHLHLKDIAIMIDAETRYGSELAYTFEHYVPDYVNIYKVYYHTGESRFHNEIDRLKKLPVDGVYCPGDGAASAYLVRAIRDAYPDIPVMGADRWENPSFKSVGEDAVEGVYYTAHYARYETFNLASDTFLELYRKKYGSEPTSYAAIGYDAYNLLLEAVVKTGSEDPKVVARYLRHLDSFDGALGISKRFTSRSVPVLKQQGSRGTYVGSVEVER
ncbi:MAG: ABC transporter substrate-binding protein [Peptoniphilus sp.]|nr:ABC transporter substrate-binding protein [Peptoniphilus sp.]MDD7362881.1 ABC transporter substrate-binding protein [Bacillota bacterium]MDY6044878.1 ABC transporter substrate-binding protein [Peptoniphilus sp.]